ncbi:NUDIX hydrolase [Rhizobiaceae bacterium n13]|uniref:NUDIX hydrolase n=1 Tax=Ferirhizobium litorale TaxID=2927786 RepID=A0AAE3U3I7_9HYPH|nr:NUDIX hydrolase [Fererhizobium litorale]MDI7864385.1 NUDIX hydrolase [Fererhizobium litorale]MDI7924701.1 NUDIX hydrolase [Fererhizobium litorale]
MTAREADIAANKDVAGAERKPVIRPRDAASLILLDRSGPRMRVLVGLRSSGHAFMPDTYVFPGGRCDPGDHALPYSSDFHPLVLDKLASIEKNRRTPRRLRALGLAAIRELEEETGVVIGADQGVDNRGVRKIAANLSCLRFVARAITPPRYNRRFDARFFCTFADEAGIDPSALRASRELHDLQWIEFDNISDVNMPDITQWILADVGRLLQQDPSLPYGRPVSFYFNRRGQHVRLSI